VGFLLFGYYDLEIMKDASLAIDVGATKVAVGLIGRDGEVIARTDISSKVGSSDELNDSLSTAISQICHRSGVKIVGAGIGSAGPIDKDLGTINPVNIPHCLFGVCIGWRSRRDKLDGHRCLNWYWWWSSSQWRFSCGAHG
jgi:ROK family